jgi:soluble epoxide hydrolase / lipid-phosphate phosphatase
MHFITIVATTFSLAAMAVAHSAKMTLADGTTYAYTRILPSCAEKPTFLLLHGFPATSVDWDHTIPGLVDAGYGVIAPDLLGFGDSDHPEAVEDYSFIRISGHMDEILKREGLDQIIPVGHDM